MKTIRISIIVLSQLIFFSISADAAQIYWNASGGSIQRANLDGSGWETVVEDSVHGIAVDSIHGRLYWNNPVDVTMRWAKLDGTDIQTIATGTGSGDITLDLIHDKIYWNASGGSIQRANLDGSGRETVIEDYVAGIAVDPIHGRLYWNNPFDIPTLRWAKLDGTDIQTIATGTGSGDISLDLIHDKIYWNASGGSIDRANLDGSGWETVIEDHVHGIVVDPINDRIYWNNPVDVTMRWARLDGTDIQTIATGTGSGAMALDALYIPEPASLVLFVLGGITLRRKK